MKQNFLKWMVCMCFGLLSVATVMAGGNYKTVKVKAPFPMQPIKVFIYPDRDFKITDFGAVRVEKLIIPKRSLLLLTHVIKRAVDVWLFRQAFG